MFDYIEGKLINIEPNYAVLDTGGWGIKCVISMFTYNKIKSELGKKTKLYIHMVLKDDAAELIGFHDTVERQAYVLLNRVSGIGSKVAISILSLMNVSQLKASILCEDVKTLVTIPGIGKKTAQKMIIELKDRIKELPVEDEVIGSAVLEAREVLVSLGFKPGEIQLVLKDDFIGENDTVEDIVKIALKKLSK
jgi:Holliday junction DNA helicase RuvA